jgi:hypothetical protein
VTPVAAAARCAGAAFHLRHAEAAAGGEHRKHAAMRGVLGEQCGGRGDAIAHHARGLRRNQRLAAQHAVLVDKRKPHDLEAVFLDRLVDGLRGRGLRGAPQRVAFDKTGAGAAAFA